MKRRKKNSLAIQSLMLWCCIKLMLSLKAHQYCLCTSTGLAIDLINGSWDKVQFMQHNNFQNVHRVSPNVFQERKKPELNGCSTALVTDKQRRLCIYQVSGQMFCATDMWDAIIVKHMHGSQFYFHFPLSGANIDWETNQIIIFCVIIRGIILFNIIAFKRIWY